MAAGTLDLVIDQGSDWEMPVVVESGGILVPFVSASARMQARGDYDETQTVIDISSPASGIVIDAPSSMLTLSLTAAQTAALAPSQYVYDLEFTNDGKVEKLFRGTLIVRPEVTKS